MLDGTTLWRIFGEEIMNSLDYSEDEIEQVEDTMFGLNNLIKSEMNKVGSSNVWLDAMENIIFKYDIEIDEMEEFAFELSNSLLNDARSYSLCSEQLMREADQYLSEGKREFGNQIGLMGRVMFETGMKFYDNPKDKSEFTDAQEYLELRGYDARSFYNEEGFEYSDDGSHNLVSQLIVSMAEFTGNWITQDNEVEGLLRECLLDNNFDFVEAIQEVIKYSEYSDYEYSMHEFVGELMQEIELTPEDWNRVIENMDGCDLSNEFQYELSQVIPEIDDKRVDEIEM